MTGMGAFLPIHLGRTIPQLQGGIAIAHKAQNANLFLICS
jgi:hypothetical protein